MLNAVFFLPGTEPQSESCPQAQSMECCVTLGIQARYLSAVLGPVSNVVLLPCKAGLTVARLQHNTCTTWFQTSNLITSNRTVVVENKTQK